MLVGSGMKPIMFENQIQKKRAAMKGNQLAAIFLSRLPPAIVFLVMS